MSLASRNPVRSIGMSPWSGGLNTGHFQSTFGGQQVYTSFSGVVVDTLVLAGGGRLDSVFRYTVGSGSPVIFYDGHVATSGGPFSTSGHKVLGILRSDVAVLSGVLTPVGSPQNVPINFGFPFFSGLIAAPIGSGTPSFSATYTPEASGFPAIP